MNIVLKSTQMIQKLFSVIFKLIFLKYFIQDVKNNKSFRDNENKVVNTEKKKAFIRGILGIILESPLHLLELQALMQRFLPKILFLLNMI